MSTYGGPELAAAFRTVRKNTLQIAEDIPESSYGFTAAPETRPVARMLMHVGVAPRVWRDIHGTRRLTKMEGYDFMGMRAKLEAEEAKPRSKAEILEFLRREGEEFAVWLEGLTPEFLAERVTHGEVSRSRLEGLMAVKEHEMHHRAQLMLMERMLGIVPHLTRQREEMIRQMEQQKAAQAAGA